MINEVVENLLVDQIARHIRHTQLMPIGVYRPYAFAHARRQLASIAHNRLKAFMHVLKKAGDTYLPCLFPGYLTLSRFSGIGYGPSYIKLYYYESLEC